MVLTDMIVKTFFGFFYFLLYSEFHQYNNDINLGMKSGRGLKPPKISSREARFPEKGQYKGIKT